MPKTCIPKLPLNLLEETPNPTSCGRLTHVRLSLSQYVYMHIQYICIIYLYRTSICIEPLYTYVLVVFMYMYA